MLQQYIPRVSITGSSLPAHTMANTFIQDSPSFLFLRLLLLIFYLPSSRSQNTTASTDPSYYYNLCSPSTCGNQSLAYPFSVATLCNSPAFTTSCPGDGYIHFSAPRQTGTIRAFGNLTSDATGLTFRVAADPLFGCGPISSPNYSYQAFFSLPNNYTFGTHLNCSKPPSSLEGLQPASCLRCANGTDQSNVCYYSPGLVSNLPECEKFFIYPPSSPGFNISAVKDLRGFLQRGFLLRYSKAAECQSCEGSGGRCGASPQGSFVCFWCSSASFGWRQHAKGNKIKEESERGNNWQLAPLGLAYLKISLIAWKPKNGFGYSWRHYLYIGFR